MIDDDVSVPAPILKRSDIAGERDFSTDAGEMAFVPSDAPAAQDLSDVLDVDLWTSLRRAGDLLDRMERSTGGGLLRTVRALPSKLPIRRPTSQGNASWRRRGRPKPGFPPDTTEPVDPGA